MGYRNWGLALLVIGHLAGTASGTVDCTGFNYGDLGLGKLTTAAKINKWFEQRNGGCADEDIQKEAAASAHRDVTDLQEQIFKDNPNLSDADKEKIKKMLADVEKDLAEQYKADSSAAAETIAAFFGADWFKMLLGDDGDNGNAHRADTTATASESMNSLLTAFFTALFLPFLIGG